KIISGNQNQSSALAVSSPQPVLVSVFLDFVERDANDAWRSVDPFLGRAVSPDALKELAVDCALIQQRPENKNQQIRLKGAVAIRKPPLWDLRPRLRVLADQHHTLFAKLALGFAENERLRKAADEIVL